ncbi:MAG TPA: twin-arginine translocase TatA/TatE family subunit [Acidimicrobiales bacterium]|nr:twin-arginine translocase TatA/TatE family subunit [Acidimicrobiales bacterium]
MFSLSPIKILVIVAVVMILLGPDKLPEVAHKLGASWRALKRIQERVESEVREVIPDLPSTGDLARLARSPVNLLNELADRADLRSGAAEAPAEDEPGEPEDSKWKGPLFDSTHHIPPTPRDFPPSPDPSLN